MKKITQKFLEEFLIDTLTGIDVGEEIAAGIEAPEGEMPEARSFEEEGVLTKDRGFFLTLPNGQTFEITITGDGEEEEV